MQSIDLPKVIFDPGRLSSIFATQPHLAFTFIIVQQAALIQSGAVDRILGAFIFVAARGRGCYALAGYRIRQRLDRKLPYGSFKDRRVRRGDNLIYAPVICLADLQTKESIGRIDVRVLAARIDSGRVHGRSSLVHIVEARSQVDIMLVGITTGRPTQHHVPRYIHRSIGRIRLQSFLR